MKRIIAHSIWLACAFFVPASLAAQDCCSSCSDGKYAGVPTFQPQHFGAQTNYSPNAISAMPINLTPEGMSIPAFQPHEVHEIEHAVPTDVSLGVERDYSRATTFSLFGGKNSTMLMDDDELFAEGSIGGEFEDGFVAGLGVGRRHSRWLRTEVEFAFRNADVSTFNFPLNFSANPVPPPFFRGDVQFYTGMFNAYFDFANRTPVTPYVGVGIGYGHIDGDISYAGFDYSAADNNGLTGQAMAGITARFEERFELFAEVRFIGSEDLSFVSPTTFAPTFNGPYLAADVIGGLRINF